MAHYVVENRTERAIALPPEWAIVKQRVYKHSTEGLNTEYVVTSPGFEDDEEVLELLVGRHFRKVA